MYIHTDISFKGYIGGNTAKKLQSSNIVIFSSWHCSVPIDWLKFELAFAKEYLFKCLEFSHVKIKYSWRDFDVVEGRQSPTSLTTPSVLTPVKFMSTARKSRKGSLQDVHSLQNVKCAHKFQTKIKSHRTACKLTTKHLQKFFLDNSNFSSWWCFNVKNDNLWQKKVEPVIYDPTLKTTPHEASKFCYGIIKSYTVVYDTISWNLNMTHLILFFDLRM